MVRNSTERMSLKTLDRLSWSPGKILDGVIGPGELVARKPE
jgi:hypothetical protein